MNSEELELSLRTEFESYLKDALAGVRQEVSSLREKVDAEFEKHKSQLDIVFQDFTARLEADSALSPAFTESVVEHLRLARDEGARITATALAEAESMKEPVEEAPPAPPAPPNYSELRDAIADISSKNSQSAILKALIQHAANFTPRGAFFIIKNEHFVGWKVFGNEGNSDEQAVRDVHFPVSADTVLGKSVSTLSTTEGSAGMYSDDADYLNKLEFGSPDKMFAIPLVARGRGVAVLYADYGNEGENVNLEAIESLVSIAGLTVELLAASHSAKAQPEEGHTAPHEDLHADEAPAPAAEEPGAFDAPVSSGFEYTPPMVDEPAVAKLVEQEHEAAPEVSNDYSYTPPAAEEADSTEGHGFSFTEAPAEEPAAEVETAANEPVVDHEVTTAYEPATTGTQEYSWGAPEPEAYKPEETPAEAEPAGFTSAPAVEYEFESTSSTFEPAVEEKPAVQQPWEKENAFEAPAYQPEVEEPKVETFESSNAYVPEPAPEPIVETVSAQPVKTRFSDRNVDLPIEVAEDERRLHNDARRFARLLVSEVKLYNEQKVKEGREANDLYERLREAIDRSREMYDKRVQPPVASKFDYFHYELVSTLAEGDEQRLGESYPGATV